METTNAKGSRSLLHSIAHPVQEGRRVILRKRILRALRVFALFSVFLVAWSLFDPHFPPLMALDARALALAAILVTAGVVDLAKGIVPVEITYPLMLAGMVRAVILGDPSFLLYWFALAVIYLFNVVGGGDLKLLMGLFGLWPHVEFFIVMEIVILATHLPIVLYRRWRSGNSRVLLRMVYGWVRIKLIDLSIGEATPLELLPQAIAHLPTSETLSERGDRLAIVFSLAGVAYLFLMTSAGLNWRW